MDYKHKFEIETGNSIYSGQGQMLPEGSYSDEFVEWLLKQLTLTDVVVAKRTLCEHNNCSWDKDPNKLKCLNCGEEISRA